MFTCVGASLFMPKLLLLAGLMRKDEFEWGAGFVVIQNLTYGPKVIRRLL